MKAQSKRYDFKNVQGEVLSGRLELPSGKPKAYALFAHCFSCSKNILAATKITKALATKGIAVLRFDFTGLGNSEGDFSNTNFSSNVEDLLAAYQALEKDYLAPSLIIGHSLGGAAVLKAAPILSKVKAIVTLGAPSKVNHVAHLFQDNLEEIKKNGLAKVNLAGREFTIKKQFIDDLEQTSILDSVANMKKAILVLHSPIDDTVSVDHASHIFKAAKHPKSYVSLDNADHLIMNPVDAEYAANVIQAWASRYLSLEDNQVEYAEKGHVLINSRGGHHFTQDIVTDSHFLTADEPRSIKGDNLGPNPYEYLLASLGSCTSMTIQMYAERKGWPLDSVHVEVSHEKVHGKDSDGCERPELKIDQLTKKISLEGNLDSDQRNKLLEIADKCPVNKTLLSSIEMVKEY